MPSGPPPQLPRALTPRDLRRTIRSVCLVVALFVASVTISAAVIVAFYAVISMMMNNPSSLDLFMSGNTAEYEARVTEYMGQAVGLISCLSIIISASWFFLIRGKRFVTTDITTKNARPSALMLLQLVVLMFGVQFLMVLINLALRPILQMIDVSATESMDDAMTSLFSTPWGILYVVIIGPIVEEMVFRGAVMRKLEPFGANFAIITSSILFGLYHIILFQAVFAFFVGMIFAYTAGRYSLKWAMALHILNNLMACISTLTETVGVAITLIYLAGFIASIALLVVRHGVLKIQNRAGAPLFPRVFKTAYSSPFFILFVVVFIFMGVWIL